MQNTKLILLLQSFSPQEIQRFQLYLKSPFFNMDEIIFQLFEAIRPFLHSRNKEIPTPQNVWEKMTQPVKKSSSTLVQKRSERFNNLQFNKHCSYLYQYAADFIALHQLKTKTNAIPLQYLQYINERNLNNLFTYHAEKLQPIIEQQNENWDIHFAENFIMQQHLHQHHEQMQSRKKQLNTAEVLNKLDDLYLYEKLKYWCAANHYKKLFDQPVTILWEDFLLQWLPENKQKNIAEIYRQVLLMQVSGNAALHYKNLKNALLETKVRQNKITQKEIYSFLIIYCIEKINQGNSDFYKEIFTLYKHAIKEQLLIQKKLMSPWDFKNIITVALQQNEINWAEKFIKSYSAFLPKDEMKNAYNYNLAKVFFMQKKYNESLKLLQQVAYTDLFYQLDIKLMQTKTLFELQEWETLDDLILSFKKLLARKRRLSKHYQTIYKKFLSYLQKLLNTKLKKDAAIVLKQLATDTQVPDKNWIEEKLKAIG